MHQKGIVPLWNLRGKNSFNAFQDFCNSKASATDFGLLSFIHLLNNIYVMATMWKIIYQS